MFFGYDWSASIFSPSPAFSRFAGDFIGSTDNGSLMLVFSRCWSGSVLVRCGSSHMSKSSGLSIRGMLLGWIWLNLGCGGRVMMVNDGTM